MNGLLARARQKCRGQKIKISQQGSGTTYVPPTNYTCKVVDSKVMNRERKGEEVPVHYIRLSILLGDHADTSLYPFAPDLTDPSQAEQSATNIQRILGDASLPGEVVNNEFTLDYDKFLGVIEDLAPKLIGERVDVTVKDRTGPNALRDDGVPWQNVWINRGLGADVAAADRQSERQAPKRTVSEDDNLDLTPHAARTKKKVQRRKKKR